MLILISNNNLLFNLIIELDINSDEKIYYFTSLYLVYSSK